MENILSPLDYLNCITAIITSNVCSVIFYTVVFVKTNILKRFSIENIFCQKSEFIFLKKSDFDEKNFMNHTIMFLEKQ